MESRRQTSSSINNTTFCIIYCISLTVRQNDISKPKETRRLSVSGEGKLSVSKAEEKR